MPNVIYLAGRRGWRPRGIRIDILCLENRVAGREHETWGHENVVVREIRIARWPRWLRELRFARRSGVLHSQSGADVLFAVRHCLSADVYQPHGGSFRAARAAQQRASPVVTRWLRRVSLLLRPSEWVLRWLDRRIFSGCPPAVTIALSRRVEVDLRRFSPDPGPRMVLLPNPVDTDVFHDRDRGECAAGLRRRFAIPAEAPVALFVGHNARLKGLRHAIDSLARASDWHLLVIGRETPDRYRHQTERGRARERVHFLGEIGELASGLCGG